MERENQNLPKNMPEIPKDVVDEEVKKEETTYKQPTIKEEQEEAKEELIKETPPPSKEDLDRSLEEVRERTHNIYNQYSKVLEEFEEASIKLIEQENEILKTTVADSMKLLNRLKVQNLSGMKESIKEIRLDNKEELLEIKKLSKGRFKGFIYGTISALLVASGLFIYGANVANLKLEPITFMDINNLDLIAKKYIEMLNLKGGAMEGYILIALVSLIVGFIVYKLTTFLQSLKNKRYVEKIKEGSAKYEQTLKEKIKQLENIIEHINKVSLVLSKYNIILQEQNAKIKRMIFIEKPESIEDLHESSKTEVKKTLLILDELLKLMNTPITKEDGSLNEDSVKSLKSANGVINEVIKNLYH